MHDLRYVLDRWLYHESDSHIEGHGSEYPIGIRVNVVSPGVVPTPGYDTLGLSKEQVQGFVDAQVAAIPLGRVGTTDEIAKTVVFLASEDSSFVNAVELFVDGVMTQV